MRPSDDTGSTFGADLLAPFDHFYIINLPDRQDRRDEMQAQLRRIGLDLDDARISLFPAIRKDSADGFPTVGTHGCFLSHLGVLKEARDRGLRRVLIAEDDLDFDPWPEATDRLLGPLTSTEWDLFFAAYHHPERFLVDGRGLIDIGQRYALGGCHLYAVSDRALTPLIAHLEAALAGPAPRPHVDVSVSDFHEARERCVTYVASPALGFQRRSRSDIQKLRLYDRIPLVRPLTDRMRRMIGRRRV